MRLGIDFDNTLVCYDRVFHRLAATRGDIPPDTPVDKTAVRDAIRATRGNDRWTELQGEVYGARMEEAALYPGVAAFLAAARDRGVAVWIVSHKTERPARGYPYDLHAAARTFLDLTGITTGPQPLVDPQHVFLEPTREQKAGTIGRLRCTHFIDDLPEFLEEPFFPSGIARILFDPAGQHEPTPDYAAFGSWTALREALLPDRTVGSGA